jgi:hypothetical protein
MNCGRVWSWLRLCGFLSLVLGLSAWWKVRQVSADVSELSASLGRGLGRLQRAAEGTTELRLNGQLFSLTTLTSEASVAQVLERFSRACAKQSGGLLEELHDVQSKGIAVPPEAASSLGVLRSITNEHEAAAGCFVRDGQGGAKDVLERAERALASGDLAALGQLRYVFAQRRASGVTHVLSLTALGRIPLVSMFPERGDAPGGDLFAGVRPPRARRVLSAQVEGSKQQIVLYEAESDPEALLNGCDAALRALGFGLGDLRAAERLYPVPTRVYFKRDDSVVLMAAPQDNGKTLVSAFRLANGGYVSMPETPFE